MLAPVTVTACFPPAVSETPGKCWRKTTAGVVSITASDWDGGQTGKNSESDPASQLRHYCSADGKSVLGSGIRWTARIRWRSGAR